MALAMTKNGNATAAPVETTTSGLTECKTRQAKTALRSRLGMFRVVGLCAQMVRSSRNSEVASGVSKVTHVRR